MLKTRRAYAFTGTLPLDAAECAAQLADMGQPNTYLDALVQGAAVGLDSDGEAVIATTTADYMGLIVTGAKENAMANPYCLANRQITYVAAPAEVETDFVATAVEYLPGDLLTPGAGGRLQKVALETDAHVAKVLFGRTAGSVAPIILLLV